MELDELKQSWKESPVNKISNKNIMDLIQHKTYGPVEALKKEFRKQMILMIVFPVIIISINISNAAAILSSVIFWCYLLFCLGIVLFARRNYHLASRIGEMDGLVKQNLQEKISLLETRMKWKVTGLRLALLFFVILTEVVPYFQHYRILDRWHSLPLIIRFGSYAALFLFQYFVGTKIIYRKFGSHLDYLKRLVKEMD